MRRDLDGLFGSNTPDVLGARCDVVAGDYWSVWPTVWHAALVNQERGSDRPVWGLTYRSGETRSEWSIRPAIRVCCLRGDDNARGAVEAGLLDPAAWARGLVEARSTLVAMRVRNP